MQTTNYERETHNCLENIMLTHADPKVWRCSMCLRITPSPKNIQLLFDTLFDEANEWYKESRKKAKLSIARIAQYADWSSICPDCAHYIRCTSRVVELIEPLDTTFIRHYSSGTEHDVDGSRVHFECYKKILRTHLCFYCGEDADTVDHIIPTSKGGEDEPYNLVAACRSCNSSKNARNATLHIIHTSNKATRENQSQPLELDYEAGA